MGKVNIKTVSGVEQNLNVVNAFTVNNQIYTAVDSGTTGSMGLPIILISKLVNNKLEKIIDLDEWDKAKEYLKMVIAGNKMEYVKVPSNLTADEIYYTQLTLPVVSYDALKNAYNLSKVDEETEEIFVPNIEVSPIPQVPVMTPEIVQPISIEPVIPTVPQPVIPVENVVEPVINQEIAPTATLVNEVVEPVITPVIPTPVPLETVPPVIEPTVVEPVISPIMMPLESVVEPVAPVLSNDNILPTPQLDSNIQPVLSNDIKYKEMKETFMLSCENIFDALIKQFEEKK